MTVRAELHLRPRQRTGAVVLWESSSHDLKLYSSPGDTPRATPSVPGGLYRPSMTASQSPIFRPSRSSPGPVVMLMMARPPKLGLAEGASDDVVDLDGAAN